MISQHIIIYNIKSWKCATPKKFKSSNISIPSYNGKSWFNKQYWLQITTTKNQKYWFSFEQFETAKNWKEEMESLMNEIKCTENNIPNNIRISEKDVSKGRPIGKGAAASVFRGTLNQNTVAIKEFYELPNMEEHREFLDEMEMLSSLHHPNIIRLFGGFINKSQSPCIVMEYASRGSLNSVLYDSMTDLTSSLKLQFIQQIAQALNYLHTFNPPIIHRDLKPSNILVLEDWSVKLTDFGSAKKVDSTMTSGQGTVKWMAPEVLTSSNYNEKADIYSFSLIMWEVLMLQNFFTEYKFDSQIEIQVVEHHKRPHIPENISSSLKQLIEDCWNPDPTLRPSSTHILNRLNDLSPQDFEIE